MLIDTYFAGLFDGEGWFSIGKKTCCKVKDGRYPIRFQPCASLVLREKFIVEGLVERYGGSITQKTNHSAKHCAYYQWRVTGTGLRKFLLECLPYLWVKFPHALVVKEMCDMKLKSGNRPISQSTYDEYCKLDAQLTALNKKGPRVEGDAMLELARPYFPHSIEAFEETQNDPLIGLTPILRKFGLLKVLDAMYGVSFTTTGEDSELSLRLQQAAFAADDEIHNGELAAKFLTGVPS